MSGQPSKSEWKEWQANDCTREFFKQLEQESSKAASSIVWLNDTGETLTKKFYQNQGTLIGIEHCLTLAKELAE